MTIGALLPAATLVATVGSSLMAGLFFAFSVAVMPALRRLNPAGGTEAMQSINSTILNPVFGVLFGGTTVLCILLAVAAPFSAQRGTVWIVVGAVLHVVGSFLVTVALNVPLNNRLAAVEPDTAVATGMWNEYLVRWTAWNHVRTVLCTASTTALALAV